MNIMKHRKLVLYVIGTLVSQMIHAEYFKHIGLFDGLSQFSVMSIYQDQLGRMWFGTKEGVNIYDGNANIAYKAFAANNRGDTNKVLIGNNVSAINGNRDGDVFLLADNALLKYDLKKETFTTLLPRSCYALASYEGDIWCVAQDTIWTYDAVAKKLNFVAKGELDGTNWLTVTASTFYISGKKGLTAIDRKSKQSRMVLEGFDVYRTFESSQKELWVGCLQDGLYRISPGGKVQKVPYSPDSSNGVSSHQIREFIEDQYHNIWFGTFDGLQKFNSRTGEYSLIKLRKNMGGLEHPSIFSLFYDRLGTIWVGSYYGGVNYFNPQKTIFSHYNYEPDADRELYYSYIGEMVEDHDGGLWIATDGGGLSRMDIKKRSFTNFKKSGANSLPHNNVKSISYDDKRHCLYIGTYIGGLSRYDLKQKRFYNYLEERPRQGSPDPGNVIFHVQFWKDRLYVSSRNGFFILNPDTDTFEQIKIPSNYCRDFELDEDGFVWGALWKKLIRISLKNPDDIQIIDLEEYGCPFDVTKVKVSKHGVYAGTLGFGLYFYDKMTKEVTRYTAEEGQLLSNYCYNVAQTQQGNILIASDKGITLFYPGSRTFRSIGCNLGFPAPAIMNGCGIYISEDNDIFVGDVQGITEFRENDLRVLDEEQQLYFSRLTVNNQHIHPDDETGILKEALPFVKELSLQYDQNNLDLYFALTNYANIMQNKQYEYMLEGFDKQWTLTKQTDLRYTNLDPGNYVLHIRVKEDTEGVNQTISLPIRIASPWYATWWAWLIYVAAFLSCITYYIRSRTAKRVLALSLEKERFEKQQIEQLNHAKLRFFTNVSHEFRTPLTLIIGHVEILLQQTSIPQTLYAHIQKISKHTRQMQNLVSELLDFRKFDQNYVILKVGKYNLATFLQEIYLYFYDYARQREIDYQFHCDNKYLECWFDSRQMEKVFFNLLSNAFKYTPNKGTISISFHVTDDEISVQVCDTGTGIETKDMERVFERFYQTDNEVQSVDTTPGTGIGLALTKSIVDKHHGAIFLESEVGKGSTFTVRLMRDKKHFAHDKDIQFVDGLKEPECTLDLMLSEVIPVTEEETPTMEEGSYTLLIVEDSEDLLQLLKKIFAPFYKVCLARNGKEGLAMAIDEKPDLIVSDVMMPEMTGTEMCMQIKNNIDLCHIPVVLLTALDTAEQNIEGLNRGADDYIAKPFNAKILLARCNNLIRNRLLMHQQLVHKPISEIELTTINPLDKDLLKQTIQIIDEHISEPEFDIPKLCRELGMGRTLLYSKFKALTGMTPNNFILNYKLKCAALMLRQQPELQIAEISDRLGFGSPIYFSRCFKGQFNTSPQNYRRDSSDTTL